MYYTCLQVTCDPEFTEIIIAEVAEAGFESFMETETGFEAFVEDDKFDDQQLDFILEKYAEVHPLSFSKNSIEKRNWNEEWEKSLETIIVDDQCLIRAEFHVVDKKYPYEIIITPKMSFGTGHHQTTWLMISNQMKMDHQDKRVMDAGCGTAILSIMASLRGARSIEAFDVDEWSVINGQENADKNHCTNIHLYQGKIAGMKFAGLFDIVLANINKNILLQEIESYSGFLTSGGQLLISGFYVHDAYDMAKEALKHGLIEERRSERETWASVLFRKS
jgi:ribosomal protein L11 methyltransferase